MIYRNYFAADFPKTISGGKIYFTSTFLAQERQYFRSNQKVLSE